MPSEKWVEKRSKETRQKTEKKTTERAKSFAVTTERGRSSINVPGVLLFESADKFHSTVPGKMPTSAVQAYSLHQYKTG
jgi:peptide methionine sulfoxide reductase MsrB